MAENQWMEKVEEMAGVAATQQGCVLYDVDFVGVGKGRTLRVFIDKDSGIGIEDCSEVSKALNTLLDENDIIPGGAYNLEVSSPGLERQLRKPWHFEKAVGKKVLIKTSKALESVGVTDKKWKAAKTVEEVLAAADGESIRFLVKEGEIRIPYDLIERAKVVFEMNKGQKR
jgi:ribosome maturation factor RimP